MRGHLPEIRELGAELTLIGSGNPAHARAFRDDLRAAASDGAAVDEPLRLCDTKLEAVAAAGLRRSNGSPFSLSTLKHGWRAYQEGHRQSAVQGDPWQQGGVFAFAPGDVTLFAYVSRSAGDHPDPARFLEALRRART